MGNFRRDEIISTPMINIIRASGKTSRLLAGVAHSNQERLVSQASTPVRWFVLDAQAMVDVDTTGAGVLRQAITLLKKQNITFAVSRADRSFRSWIERYHLMELIDPARFYPTNRHAAQAFRQSPESTTAKPGSSAVDQCDEGGD